MSGENYINHVVLVLDASLSMSHRRNELIQVADGQVKYLARRSKELDQETRVSIYAFDHRVQCLVYDKDVLRLPSIATLYQPNGRTAMIDATIKALEDLAETPQRYGDHAFLTFVLTDGEENASRWKPDHLTAALNKLPEHWTVGVLVPDMMGKHNAQSYGFPPANIAVWDAETAQGFEEAGEVIQAATENFLTSRTRGVRGTKQLFSLGPEKLNKATVSANLTPLTEWQYDLVPVFKDGPIREYIESRGMPYNIGKCFYQLMKAETIQGGKQIAIREKKDPNRRGLDKVYVGDQARQILGLPDVDVRIKPDVNPSWDVFVQSASVNRKLISGTDVLVLR
jgi:uncharacterized protein YegL